MSDIDGSGTGAIEHPVRNLVLGVVLFLVCVGLGGAGAAVYTHLQPSLYSSKSVVRVFDPTSLPNQTSRVDPTRLVSLEVTYAQSQDVSDVAAKAIAAAGVRFDHVTWAALSNQDAVSVTCFAPRPGNAVRCANEYAAAYVANRAASVPQSLSSAAALVQASIDQKQIQANYFGRLVAATDPKTKAAKSKEYTARQAALLSQVSQLTQQVNLDRAQARALASSYKVVQPAPFPTAKSSPTPARNWTIGLVGGALLGLALLLLWQQVATMRRARRRLLAPPAATAPAATVPATAPAVTVPATELVPEGESADSVPKHSAEAPSGSLGAVNGAAGPPATPPAARKHPPKKAPAAQQERRRAGRSHR